MKLHINKNLSGAHDACASLLLFFLCGFLPVKSRYASFAFLFFLHCFLPVKTPCASFTFQSHFLPLLIPGITHTHLIIKQRIPPILIFCSQLREKKKGEGSRERERERMIWIMSILFTATSSSSKSFIALLIAIHLLVLCLQALAQSSLILQDQPFFADSTTNDIIIFFFFQSVYNPLSRSSKIKMPPPLTPHILPPLRHLPCPHLHRYANFHCLLPCRFCTLFFAPNREMTSSGTTPT